MCGDRRHLPSMGSLRGDVDVCIHRGIASVPTTTIRRGTDRVRLDCGSGHCDLFIAIMVSSTSAAGAGMFAILYGGMQIDSGRARLVVANPAANNHAGRIRHGDNAERCYRATHRFRYYTQQRSIRRRPEDCGNDFAGIGDCDLAGALEPDSVTYQHPCRMRCRCRLCRNRPNGQHQLVWYPPMCLCLASTSRRARGSGSLVFAAILTVVLDIKTVSDGLGDSARLPATATRNRFLPRRGHGQRQ